MARAELRPESLFSKQTIQNILFLSRLIKRDKKIKNDSKPAATHRQ